MVTASTTRATATILIGRTGGDAGYRRLVDALRTDGYDVKEEPSSPIGAHSSLADAAMVLDGVDMAFLAVRDADDVSAIGPVRPFQRVARDIGIMQGQLGMDRVVLLVDDSVAGLSSDLGVGILRLPPDGPIGALGEIKRRIGQAAPIGGTAAAVATREPPEGLHGRLSDIERSRADNMLMPVVLLIVIAVMALIGAILLAARLLGGGGGESGDGQAQLIDVTEALRDGGAIAGRANGLGAGGSEASTGSTTDGDRGSAAAPAPAGPSAGFGGDNQLLPATCELDLLAGSLVDSVDCAGAGVLSLAGSDGPWHNELAALAISDGVSGELIYEGNGQAVALDSGVVVLDADQAAFGVTSITVTFSAVGQHIHLFDDADGQGREATLTLRLER